MKTLVNTRVLSRFLYFTGENLSICNFELHSVSHHTVSPQQQRGDLTDRWRVAIVVTRQVPSAPATVGHTVLAVVTWTQHPIETKEQQDEQNPGRQTQGCDPVKPEPGLSKGKLTYK